jgi:hypothetical protein
MGDKEVNVRFKVNDDGSVVLDKISQKMTQVESHTKGISQSMDLIKGVSLVYLGEKAVQAAGQMFRLAESTANFGGEIERNSIALGMTISEYQRWTYVAKSADVEIDQFLKGVRSLTNVMNESPDKVERFGISIKDATGGLKDIDTILPELITRLSKIGNTTELNAAAMDIFGARSGMAFATMIRDGKNIDEITRHFKEMNLEISGQTIRNLAASEQAFKDLEFAGKKLKASLHPVVMELARDAEWWASAIGRVVDKFEAMQEQAAANKLLELKRMLAASRSMGAVDVMGVSSNMGSPEYYEKQIKELQESWKISTKAPGAGMTGTEGQSAEAAKGLAKALEAVATEEAKLNSFYADDVEKFKTLNRLADERSKAGDIMGELGIKTRIGAEKEIAGIQEKYKMLMGKGYSPEEMEQARVKLEAQLKALESKYKTESGWKATGEEGGVRWWQNEMPKAGVGADITGMVKSGIDELNRMQKASEGLTGPKVMMIDSTQVQSANEMVEKLRANLAEISNKPIVLTIEQRVSGDVIKDIIERVDEGQVANFTNKRSRLNSIVKKEIGDATYYGNE